MKRNTFAFAAAASLLALASCDGNPTDPRLKQVSLEIRLSAVITEEETVAVGDSIRLDAVARQANGDLGAGNVNVSWKSENPSVASVSSTGTVTGLSVGTTRVIASSGRFADTIRINVAEPVTGPIECAPGQTPLRLERGQVLTLSGPDAVSLCIDGAGSTSEYTLIPFNTSSVAENVLQVNVTGTGLTNSVFGPPAVARYPFTDLGPRPLRRDERLHVTLREQSARALEPRLRALSGVPAPPPAASAVAREGETLRLNVKTGGTDGCAEPDYHQGRVVAVTQRAVVVADVANPAGGFTDEEYRSFGVVFDTLVWDLGTRNFGQPSDVDDNERVILFFTGAVNELTGDKNASSYTAGFFFNRDLFPKTGSNACAGSNYAEIIYLMAPDPKGEIGPGFNARSVEFVRDNTTGVLAHEFQHLINDSRRLYELKASMWEETWLNEGLSHIAEELAFYEAAGLAPMRNLDPGDLRGTPALALFNEYAAENFSRFREYLTKPEDASLMGKDEIPTRGATWSFLRYAADRLPGEDDATLWKSLVGSKQRGLENLRRALGVDPLDWMQEWSVAVYLDDALTGFTPPVIYQQPSWNFREIIPAMGNGTFGRRYPLATYVLRPGRPHAADLQGGGTLYLRFGVPADGSAALRTTVKNLPPPSRLRISILRTR